MLPIDGLTMNRLRSPQRTARALHREITRCLGRVRRISSRSPSDLEDGVAKLRELRKAVFEDINQIQHEALALAATRWLQKRHRFTSAAVWEWNPRASGTGREPDLRVKVDGKVVVSAEATASEEAKGILDSRMRDTLAKLARMRGRKYYFVRTEAMARRARSKVQRNCHKVEVVRL
jgi:hypothetical protein